MSITTALRRCERPRWITPFDACRSYVLYDDVECNIPRWGALGEYGAWDWARGHLVELHRRLGGSPVSLRYHELLACPPHLDPSTTPAQLPVGNEVTTRLGDRAGELVTVVTRAESAPYGPRGDFWQVEVNGEIPDDADDPALHGVQTYPPSLPYLAHLVAVHLDRVAARPLAPVVPLRRA